MEELCCDRCGLHIGWMNDAGPRGSIYCDECKDETTPPPTTRAGDQDG